MNRHVAALWEASTFPTLPNRLITPVNHAVGIVRVYNLSVLIEQHGIHLRMRGSRSIRLNDINEGSRGICCGYRRISPLNVRIASRGNANIAIGEHGRSSFTISGRILLNRFLKSIYGSVRRIAHIIPTSL